MDKKTITFRADPKVYRALCAWAKKNGMRRGEAIEEAMKKISGMEQKTA